MTSGQGYFYIAKEIYPNSAYNNFTLELNPGLTAGRVPVPYPGGPSDPDPMTVYCSVVNSGDTPITVRSAVTTPGKNILFLHAGQDLCNCQTSLLSSRQIYSSILIFRCRHQHHNNSTHTTQHNMSKLFKITQHFQEFKDHGGSVFVLNDYI